MARVVGLGHVGIYVRDLERMVAFYRDVLGMQVTKQRRTPFGQVMLSADPAAADHEIIFMEGRPEGETPRHLQHVALQVESLADVRAFHERLRAEGCRIHVVANHGSAIGCYFDDPEGNRAEVFWRTGYDCWAPTLEPIDLAQSDEAIMTAVQRVVEREKDVPVGGLREPAPA
jgi:catechol 2,3-dioxygenase-like lactoylglutathione lyase family enzyme